MSYAHQGETLQYLASQSSATYHKDFGIAKFLLLYLHIYLPLVIVAALPAKFIEMAPPHIHMHFALLSNAGIMQTLTWAGGAHGAVMAGTQGIGVSTPIAAAVAAATVGLASDWHMPKGLMFTIGAMSMMFAIGIFPHIGRIPTTVRGDGATPNEH